MVSKINPLGCISETIEFKLYSDLFFIGSWEITTGENLVGYQRKRLVDNYFRDVPRASSLEDVTAFPETYLPWHPETDTPHEFNKSVKSTIQERLAYIKEVLDTEDHTSEEEKNKIDTVIKCLFSGYKGVLVYINEDMGMRPGLYYVEDVYKRGDATNSVFISLLRVDDKGMLVGEVIEYEHIFKNELDGFDDEPCVFIGKCEPAKRVYFATEETFVF